MFIYYCYFYFVHEQISFYFESFLHFCLFQLLYDFHVSLFLQNPNKKIMQYFFLVVKCIYILKPDKKKEEKKRRQFMNDSDEIKSNTQSSLYKTVNKIQEEECMEGGEFNIQEKEQKILSQLNESNIVEMLDYQTDDIQERKENKEKQCQGYQNEKQTEKNEPKCNKKFTIKPSMSKPKLQNISLQYMDSLFKQLKCPKHWQNHQKQTHLQLFICLENLCDCQRTKTEPKISNIVALDHKFLQENKGIKSPINRIKSVINRTTCKEQQDGVKQIQIRQQIEAQIQAQMIRTQSLKKLQQKILCQQCLNEKLHRGHKICTLKKFQSLVCQYHWASTQATKDLLSKIIQLRTNLDFYFNVLSNKAIEIMTLGMVDDWEDYRTNFYKYNLSRNSKLRHKNKEFSPSNYQFFSQLITNKSSSPNRETNYNQNINVQSSFNIQELFSLNALEIWQQLLSTSKSAQMQTINGILKYKQQIILQQIQYIDNNFKEVISNCINNLQFVNNFKDWVFNPDDMCQGEVGLTLDRNKVQGLKNKDKDGQSYSKLHQTKCMKTVEKQTQTPNNLKKKSNKNTYCKIAFTQTPLSSENSRSFRIQQLKEEIVIGCVNSGDHILISEKLHYSHYQKYLYGISVNVEGQITVYNKGEKPYIAQFAKLLQNDVIQVTLHAKNSTITFIKYSSFGQEGEQSSNIKKTQKMEFTSLAGRISNRTVIATLPIQLIDTNLIYYLFAGVKSQGDCISLTENIMIQSKFSTPVRRVLKESQKTMRNNKQSELYNQTVSNNFNNVGIGQKIDKALS